MINWSLRLWPAGPPPWGGNSWTFASHRVQLFQRCQWHQQRLDLFFSRFFSKYAGFSVTGGMKWNILPAPNFVTAAKLLLSYRRRKGKPHHCQPSTFQRSLTQVKPGFFFWTQNNWKVLALPKKANKLIVFRIFGPAKTQASSIPACGILVELFVDTSGSLLLNCAHNTQEINRVISFLFK